MADIRFFRGEVVPSTDLQRLQALTGTMERTASLNPSIANTAGVETLRTLNNELEQIFTNDRETNPSL